MPFSNSSQFYTTVNVNYNKATKLVTLSSGQFGVNWVKPTLASCDSPATYRRGIYYIGYSNVETFNHNDTSFPQINFTIWNNSYDATEDTLGITLGTTINAYTYNSSCRDNYLVAQAFEYDNRYPTLSTYTEPYSLESAGGTSLYCGTVNLYGVIDITLNVDSQPPLTPLTPTYIVSNICDSGNTLTEFTITSTIAEPYRVDTFGLYRSTTSGGTYTRVDEIDTASGVTIYYTGGTTGYWYYIQAENELYSASTAVFYHEPTPPVIEASVVPDDYPTLTFIAQATNYCSADINWYLDGVLTGTSTGSTYSGVLPTSGDTYILTARYVNGGIETLDSNEVSLSFFDTTPIISGFTGNGTFTLPSGYNRLEYVIVGGGGAASGGVSGGVYAFGGNGGAGGFLEGLIINPSAGTYSVVVGSGGTAADAFAIGTNGGYSSFSGLTAYGGGAGGHKNNTSDGFSGACGGGAAVWREVSGGAVYTGSGGTAINGQGYSGASSSYDISDPNKQYPGGGGGAGSAAYGVSPWTGGTGRATTITGDSFTFATGGWGGALPNIGGSGAAVDGTGDGGGHTNYTPYGGGSGIVIIKYWNSFGIPTAPIADVENIGCDNATLTWVNTETIDITGNTIQQYTGTTWFDVAEVASDATSFELTGLTPLETYVYRIVAKNSAFTTPSNTVIFQTLNPTPYNVVANNEIVTWDLNDPTFGDNIRPEYRLSGTTTWFSEDLLPTTATTYTYTGLTFDETYEIRMVKVDGLDEYPSDSINFVNLNPTPYNLQLKTVVTPIDDYDTVTWDMYFPDFGDGIYPEIKLTRSSYLPYTRLPLIPTDSQEYQFSGLTDGWDYTVRLVKIDGTDEYISEPFTFEAYTPEVSSIVLNSVDDITFSGASANSTITGNSYTITQRGVVWDFRPTPNIIDNPYSSDGSGDGTYDSDLTGLTSDRTYYVRAYAIGNFDGAEKTFYSNEIEFTTLKTYVPTVKTISVTGVTYSEAYGTGQVTDAGTFPVTEYGIVWNSTGNPTIDDDISSNTGESFAVFTELIDHLAPNQTYYVRAYAINAIGVGYGRAIAITTLGLDTSTYLRFADGVLADILIDDFEVHVQLNDIKNIDEAKTSFTMPIKLPYSQDNVNKFSNLFNVNSVTDITDQKIECKLIQKNEVIVDGYMYVEDWDFDYINLIVARNDIGIFDEISNKSLNELNFTGSTYEYSGKTKYDRLVTDVTGFTPTVASGYTDHMFVNIDWWGTFNKFYENITPSRYGDTYDFNQCLFENNYSPVIKVKTVLDKIIEEAGYSYSGTSTIMDSLENLYMTTPIPKKSYADDVDSYYLIKEASSGSGLRPVDTYDESGTTVFYLNEISGTSKIYGNVCDNPDYATIDGALVYSPFKNNNNFIVELNIYAEPTTAADASFRITIQHLNKLTDEWEDSTGFGDITVEGTVALYNTTIDIKPSWCEFGPDLMRITVETDNASLYTANGQAGITDCGITITSKDYSYFTGTTYTLTDLLPANYTQRDLLTDLFKLHNIYAYVSDDDIYFLNLKSFDDFYIDDVLDWTNKFTSENIKLSDTSKELYNYYNFTNALGTGAINKTFQETYGELYGDKLLENDNDVSLKTVNDIKTKATNGILFANDSNPIMIHNEKENSGVIFGYINKFDNLNIPLPMTMDGWGLIGANTEYNFGQYQVDVFDVESYLTLSPYRFTGTTVSTPELAEYATDAFLFENKDIFVTPNSDGSGFTGLTVTNNTLYNKFWKADIEKKVNAQQRFVKCYANLIETDIKIENFRKRIWIENQKLGDAYYRLNKIVYSTDESKLSYLELVNEVYYNADYDYPDYDFTRYDYDNDTSEIIVWGSQDSEPVECGTGDTQIYLSGLDSNTAVMAVSGDSSNKSYAIDVSYNLYAMASNSFMGYRTSYTNLYYSVDYGFTWETIATAFASVFNQNDTDTQTVTGTTTISGVTYPQAVRFKADWDYSLGHNNGTAEFTVTSAAYDCGTGTVTVGCDNHGEGGGESTVLTLSCE